MSNPFLESLLGGHGCSADGTMTRNPITGMAERVLESHLGIGAMGEHQSFGGMEESQGLFMDGSTGMPGFVGSSSSGEGGMTAFPSHWMQNFNSGGPSSMATTAGNNNMTMGGSSMMPPPAMYGNNMFMMQQMQQQQMMHMQMQQQQMMMMHQQHNKANFRAETSKAAGSKKSPGLASKQSNGKMTEPLSEADQEWNEIHSKYGLTMAMEEALDQGDLTAEKLDEIWRTFGHELTADDPQYKSTSAVDWREERDRQQAAQGIAADISGELLSDDLNVSSSAQGYQQAWNNLSKKLEGLDKNAYHFSPNNTYLTTSPAAIVDHASAATVATTTTEEKDADGLFEKGMDLFKSGNVREAILAFEAGVQVDPEHAEGWRMLGVCHAENDEDKKAIVCLRRAVDADPYNVDALLALGTSYVNELDSVRALEALRSWVTHNPLFQGIKVASDEYSDGSLMDEVVQLMLAVSMQAPDNCDVHVVLGVLYNVSQDYDGAIECFRKCLALQPDNYSLYNKLGATLANSNNSEEALTVYAQALNIRPKYARGWLNLGISHANLMKYEDAARAYVRALHLTPTAKHIWGYLRVVLTNMNRLDLAELSGQENTVAIAKALGVEL